MGQNADAGNQAATSGVLGAAALCLGLLDLCLVACVVLADGATAQVTAAVVAVGLGAAAVQGTVAALAHRGAVTLQAAQPLLACCVLLVAAPAALWLGLSGDRSASAVLALAVVAAGATAATVPWLMVVIYGSWAMWLAAALAQGTWAGWRSDAVTVFGASVLAAAASVQRRRDLRSLRETRGLVDAAAVRDPLTGLANRQGLALLGSQLLEVARRQGDAVHCVFLDVDGFGRMSSMLGDEVGNDVLMSVGDALRHVTRGTDVVARWSGDEFAIVGPGPGMAPLELERRVRERLAAEEVVDPRRWDLGITAGSAVLAPWDLGSLDTLLRRADQELNLRRTLRRESSPLPRRDPAA